VTRPVEHSGRKTMKQIDYHTEEQVGFSLHTYDSEADALIAFDRESMKFGKGLPAGTKTP
jgi:hypothetical protein